MNQEERSAGDVSVDTDAELERLRRWADEHGEDGAALAAESRGEL